MRPLHQLPPLRPPPLRQQQHRPPDDDGGADDSYIPLNARTYREGFLRLRAWSVFSALALLAGALLALYEVRLFVRLCW